MYLSILRLSSVFGWKGGREIIPRLSYCIQCGSRLEQAHRYCWNCGTARYTQAAGPPGPGEQRPSQQPPQPRPVGPPPITRQALAAAGERPKPPGHVTIIAVLSAAAAVMFLVVLVQFAALIINPHGRDSLNQILVQAGVTAAQRPSVLVLYEVIWVLGSLVPAVLHGIAFYGLMGMRRGGWVVAFLLACAWSIVLIGIPFAILLWRRDTRAAFGLT
jgi:hypothetical protein